MKVVTFGEIMLRLSTQNQRRFSQSTQFDVSFGGSEANVAVILANLGVESYFVTRLPNNELGDYAIMELRKYGVKTDYIIRGGDRIGIYFLEVGASQRPSKVIYDRAFSAITEFSYNMLNWDEVFKNANWFHISGITPALSNTLVDTSIKVVEKAKQMGVTVSCDINYRKKLWPPSKAQEVMSELVKNADLVIGNEEDIEIVFGIKAPESDVEAGIINVEGYKNVCEQLSKKFPNVKRVAITLRESISASVNNWSAVLWDNGNFYQSKKYTIHVVDRVGSGDAFCGGLIYSFLKNASAKDALEFAVAASCLVHSIPGDFGLLSIQEIEALATGPGTGRIVR